MSKDENTTTVAVSTRERIESFHAAMRARASITREDRADEILERQAEAIFNAETVDAILTADSSGTPQMRDVPDTVWEFRGFEPVISTRTFDDGQESRNGYYITCDVTYLGGPRDIATKNGLKIGQTYALQTGADLAVFKLAALERAEGFPIRLTVLRLKTQSGNHLIKLGEAPDMAMGGTAE